MIIYKSINNLIMAITPMMSDNAHKSMVQLLTLLMLVVATFQIVNFYQMRKERNLTK